jgi:hypothetical protein
MRARVKCDEKAHIYRDKGVKVCPEWDSYETFMDDMGECPDGYSLERINVNGNYCPSNCKWIPILDQAKNKRNTIYVEYMGKRERLRDLCERLKVNYGSAYNRYHQQDSIDVILGDSNAKREKIEWQGSLITFSEASLISGIKRKTLQNRVKILGWTDTEAMNTPVQPATSRSGTKKPDGAKEC